MSTPEITFLKDEIHELRVDLEHTSGTVKAMDAGYKAVTDGVLKNIAELMNSIKKQSNEIENLKISDAKRQGRESFIVAILDKWPVWISILGLVFIFDHGNVSLRNPLEKIHSNYTTNLSLNNKIA